MGQDLGTIRLALRSPGDETADETRGCTMDRLLGRGDVADPDAGNGDGPDGPRQPPPTKGRRVHPRAPTAGP